VRWRITLIKGTPAKFLGYIEAPNEKSAIETAGHPSHGPTGGVADTLEEAKAAFRPSVGCARVALA
jgi:hypothetical protein